MPVIRRHNTPQGSLGGRPTQGVTNKARGYLAPSQADRAVARSNAQAAQANANIIKTGLGLVGTATNFYARMQAEQEKADDFSFKIAATKFDGDQDAAYNESKASLSGDGQHWRNENMQRYEAAATSFMDGLPASQQERAKLFIEQRRNKYSNRSYNDMQRYRQDWALTETRNVVDGSLVPNITEKHDDNLALLGQMDALIEGAQVATPRVKEQLRKHAINQVYRLRLYLTVARSWCCRFVA